MSEINKDEISAFAAQLVAEKLSSGKDNGELRAEIKAKINEKVAYETERNQIMRKLQLEELEILKYFDAFCRENNLRYWNERQEHYNKHNGACFRKSRNEGCR